MHNNIADIRKDYRLRALDEHEVSDDPFTQFKKWWDEATQSDIEEVNAMTLATASSTGKPSARIVLLKDFDEQGFVFFTNYQSHKGKEIEANPQAALVLFWKELERQVRIEGSVEKIAAGESEAYFCSRPIGSRLGAWASPQSTVIASRQLIEENMKRLEEQANKENIGRPPHWGGYRVRPDLVEFWQGRSNRLHDRLQYTLQPSATWKLERLAP